MLQVKQQMRCGNGPARLPFEAFRVKVEPFLPSNKIIDSAISKAMSTCQQKVQVHLRHEWTYCRRSIPVVVLPVHDCERSQEHARALVSHLYGTAWLSKYMLLLVRVLCS